jgi:hypothetical protein
MLQIPRPNPEITFYEAFKKYFSDHHLLEIITAILLSFAGAATSWSGYQAALWSGIEAASYTEATALRLESTRASTEAGQLAIADVSLFIEWLNAYATRNKKLADFYRARFRPEFVPAFEAWLASNPIKNPHAYRTPFKQPEYQPEDLKQAKALNEKSVELFKRGQEANEFSDSYVLNTVLLAMVMFLCSIAQQFKRPGSRLLLLAVSLLITVAGILNFLHYPIAPR